mgnify:CR=1 FL=1
MLVSPNLHVKHGVPLGSVLSTMLFLIYFNVFLLPLEGIILDYADVTFLLYNATTAERVNADFRQDEKLLTLWFSANFLRLNVNKCRYVLYSFKRMAWEGSVNLNIG